jgi:uncharacterized RDD family membrane protein YckC
MKSYNKLRLKALIIDVALISIIWIVVFAIYVYLLKESAKYDYKVGLSLLLSLFLCKDSINGQSVGKRICNLKVVDYKGYSLSLLKLIVRNLFVFLAPIEFFVLLHNEKRIGDNVIKSRVILVKRPEKVTFMNVLIYLLILFITIVVFLFIV